MGERVNEDRASGGRVRATGREKKKKERTREKQKAALDESVGVFIGVTRGEINKKR